MAPSAVKNIIFLRSSTHPLDIPTLKWLVHPKMKIMSLMTLPHVMSSQARKTSVHLQNSLRYFRFSPRAFCPSIENTVYCPCPERK